VAVCVGVMDTCGCMCWRDGYVWLSVLGRWVSVAVCVGVIDTFGALCWGDCYV